MSYQPINTLLSGCLDLILFADFAPDGEVDIEMGTIQHGYASTLECEHWQDFFLHKPKNGYMSTSKPVSGCKFESHQLRIS